MRNRKLALSLLSAGVCLLLLVIFSFLPLAPPTMDNTVALTARLASVTEGSSGDIIISLQNDTHNYYINRGLERGLKLSELQARLEGNMISLRYVRHWSLLNPLGKLRPVAQLSSQHNHIFDDIHP